MDMSVTVGAAREPQPAKAEAKRVTRGANSSDLDAWLEKVEALGELKRITAEVDPNLEAATITYLVGNEKSPALLFENIKGHPGHRALYNMIGCNLSRFCLMIREQPGPSPQGGADPAAKARPENATEGDFRRSSDLQPEHRRGG